MTDDLMPDWILWLVYAMVGVTSGLLVGAIIRGDAFGSAMYSPVAILYVVLAVIMSSGYIEERS